MHKVLLAQLVTNVLCISPVLAQATNWLQVLPGTDPGQRSSHSMAYFAATQRVVLFGGATTNGGVVQRLDDTWTFDGITWSQVATTLAPSPRSNFAIAYDSHRNRLVLFGGYDGSLNLADTWEFDGQAWQLIQVAVSPPPRRSTAMAFDSQRGRVVMFGGTGPGGRRDDTWTYDGSTWTQVITSNHPSAREWHKTAYDSTRDRVVLFGGSDGGPTADTWEFDGTTWLAQSHSQSPSPRQNHELIYDLLAGEVALFGGEGFDETWRYDGLTWTPVATTAIPPARGYFGAAYDTTRGRTVIYGGATAPNQITLDDTWELTGPNGPPTVSSATPYGTGCGSPAVVFAPATQAVIGTTASAIVANPPTPFGGVTMGLSKTLLSGLPILPLELSIIGMPGCHLLHSNDAFGQPVTATTTGTLQFNFGIPLQANLLGLHVYVQAYCVAPGANASQIVTSNGIDWLIGNQ